MHRQRWTPASRAGAASFLVLLALYCITLAPDIALWDAGEFSAAAAIYGIPHPPGTPLYVTVARAWTVMIPWLSPAVAVNLLSAVSSAAAFALLGALIARRMHRARWGIAAAVCAGSYFTAWNASTSSEVYAPALLLGVGVLWAAEYTGAAQDAVRRRNGAALTAYLVLLAVPLHLTALLVVPAAMVLASRLERSGAAAALIAGGSAAVAVGITSPSIVLLAGGLGVMGVGAWLVSQESGRGAAARAPTAIHEGSGGAVLPQRRRGAVLPLVAVIAAASAIAILPLRARHDPPLNQGAPENLPALAAVLQRHQYDVAPLWPRQAPLWLQAGNLFQYADFQVAMGLGRGPVPTIPRVALSLLFAAVAVLGARSHLRNDRTGFAAVLMLLLAGGPGAVWQLNLKAGPSYGYNVLPDGASREARERDYFFLVGFAAWGVWAGMGAVVLAAQSRNRAMAGTALMLPLLPIALNYSSTSARFQPNASLARDAAELLLNSAPPNAVLLTAGDNDTYPLWYVQMAEMRRPDVTVVPVAMLPAGWFQDELGRRARLDASGSHHAERITTLLESAALQGRPVAASPVLGSLQALSGAGERQWRWRGVIRVLDSGSPQTPLSREEKLAIETGLRRQGATDEVGAAGALRVDPAPVALRTTLLCAGISSELLPSSQQLRQSGACW